MRVDIKGKNHDSILIKKITMKIPNFQSIWELILLCIQIKELNISFLSSSSEAQLNKTTKPVSTCGCCILHGFLLPSPSPVK